MVIKEGYKQTEIGVIPYDWEVNVLNEISSITRLAGYEYSTVWKETENGEIIALRGFNIGKNKIIERDLVRISNKLSMRLIRSRLFNGDVVYPCVGTIGNAVAIEEDDKYHIQQNIAKITPKKNKLHSKFLAHYLMSDFGFKEIEKFNGSSSQPNILVGSLRKYTILVPTIAEQTAIATALSDADGLITGLEKLIAKKRNIKQGAMQQLLQPKEGWEVKKFKDLCWFQEGPGLRNWQFTKRGIKVINVTNLVNGVLNLDRTSRHISIDEFNKMYQHFEIDENDIVVASSGNSYGKVAVVRKQDLPLVMNTSVIRFKPFESLDYNFLLIFLKSVHFKEQIDLLITGGAQPNFGPVHLNKIIINIPSSKEEQIRIATILSDMDAELSVLEQKLEKYKKVKLGMMQELLTGKTRLV